MISVVLIGAKKSGNVGSVARAMANFDFSNLILIEPKCKINSVEARKMAKHAGEIIKKAKAKKISCLNDFDFVIGTTSKLGTDYNIPRTPLSPEQLAGKIAGIKSRKIALVFGREDSGLTNKEIELCDFLVTIPTSKKYPAMNLSHSVSVVLYEIYKKIGKEKVAQYPLMDKTDKKHLLKAINDALDRLEFKTKNKKETQKKLWKKLTGKSFLTKREAFALMGFFKKIK